MDNCGCHSQILGRNKLCPFTIAHVDVSVPLIRWASKQQRSHVPFDLNDERTNGFCSHQNLRPGAFHFDPNCLHTMETNLYDSQLAWTPETIGYPLQQMNDTFAMWSRREKSIKLKWKSNLWVIRTAVDENIGITELKNRKYQIIFIDDP